jgi:superfamily II DNA or RNA helicase
MTGALMNPRSRSGRPGADGSVAPRSAEGRDGEAAAHRDGDGWEPAIDIATRLRPARAGGGVPQLIGYQVPATAAIADGLREHGRGQLPAACGTGKSVIGVHAALRLCPTGVVVLACPTLPLLAQSLRLWAQVTGNILIVCSDYTVGRAATALCGKDFPVTTALTDIAAWLRRQPASSLRLILVTHRSAGIVGAGLHAIGQTADLLLIDEAHLTAGRADKKAAVVHHDSGLPARRRLYLTATPRMLIGAQDSRQVVSMDDPRIYGRELYHYPFASAIADGWLDDFRVVAIGITRSEVLHLLNQADPEAVVQPGDAPLHTAVLQTALLRAAAQYRLRRILVFTTTKRDSKRFVRTLERTAALLPPDEVPPGRLTVRHVDSDQPTAIRMAVLDQLADPPEGGWTVVSNPRCLSEGIDVPDVDAVAYARPSKAPIDIVQGVSRALRRSPTGSGIATILVPMLLPDTPGDLTDLGPWETLFQTLRALRAHDQRFATTFDVLRARTIGGKTVNLPEQVTLLLPERYDTARILDHVSVRIIEQASTTWIAGLDALTAFHAREGHAEVPHQHRENGLDLHRWLGQETELLAAGQQPPDRIHALHTLGVTTTITPATTSAVDRYSHHLAAARAFHRRHRHLRTLPGTIINNIDLHEWMTNNQQPASIARTDPELRRALDLLDPGWHLSHDPGCTLALHAAVRYHQQHGHLRPAPGTLVDNIDLHQALTAHRSATGCAAGDHTLHKLFAAMDRHWKLPAPERYQQALHAAQAFHARHGRLFAAPNTALHAHLRTVRRWRSFGLLTDWQITQWDALGIQWKPTDREYDTGLAACHTYLAREGHLRPPADHLENGVAVRDWLIRVNRRFTAGSLTEDKINELTAIGALDADLIAPTAPAQPAEPVQLTPDKDCDDGLRAARLFHAKHGHIRVPTGKIVNGIDLHAHLREIRRREHSADLNRADWDALGIIWRVTADSAFTLGIAACHEFRAREGHLNPPPGLLVNGVPLARWKHLQLRKHADNHLTNTQIDALIHAGVLDTTSQNTQQPKPPTP